MGAFWGFFSCFFNNATIQEAGITDLRSGPLSPLNKQDYPEEQRRPCLRPVSGHFGGD